jgi:hypothetical protein
MSSDDALVSGLADSGPRVLDRERWVLDLFAQADARKGESGSSDCG